MHEGIGKRMQTYLTESGHVFWHMMHESNKLNSELGKQHE